MAKILIVHGWLQSCDMYLGLKEYWTYIYSRSREANS